MNQPPVVLTTQPESHPLGSRRRLARLRLAGVLAVCFTLAAIASGCTGTVSSTVTTTLPTSTLDSSATTLSATTAPDSAPTTTAGQESTPTVLSVRVEGRPAIEPSEWREIVTIPYGQDEMLLGFDPTKKVGPEFAAVDPDGRWWVLDSQKKRIAVFDQDGHFDISIDIGRMPAQFPTVLDDGTFVAIAFDQVLLVAGDEVATPAISEGFSPLASDGSVVFGRSRTGTYPRLSVTPPDASVVSAVEWLRTRNGNRFRVDADDQTGEVAVELDGNPPVRVNLFPHPADDVNRRIAVAPLGVVTGQDGTITLLLLGAEGDTNVAAVVSISPSGELMEVAPLPSSFFDTTVEPLFGYLAIQPETSNVFLQTVDEEGLHIFHLDAFR